MGRSAHPNAQLPDHDADVDGVRFTRLVIEADRNTVSLTLHPSLTVVAGVDERVRAGLTEELIGALGSNRSGVHLELADDDGRHLAVFRPRAGSHRVIEVDDGTDITDEYRTPDGRIDLLSHHGIDPRRARELLHLDRARLQAATHHDDLVNRLAELDQTELWSAAATVRVTDDELRALNDGIDRAGEDPEAVARVEQRHQSLETALERFRLLRHRAFEASIVLLAAAVVLTLVQPALALGVLAVGVVGVLVTFVFRARVDAAQRLEDAALAEVGAASYLGFVVKRVDGMFTGSEQRRRLLAVAEDHRAAAVRWTRLTGDVSVDWAMAHHEEIETTARLRRQLRSLSTMSSTAPDLDEDAADTAQAVLAHLARLRNIGTDGESFPLILDDPFVDVPSSTKLSLLEVLGRAAGSPQVILLTDQEDVAGWARLEALTGEVALVEPQMETRHDSGASGLAV